MAKKAFCALFLLVAVHIATNKGEVTDEDLRKFADANNHLAANLFHRIIRGTSDNVAFCPASLMTGLGGLLFGARGNTEKELYDVLGYKAAGLPLEKVHDTYVHYFTNVLPENDPKTINYTLRCADGVLVKSQAQLLQSYVNEVQYPVVKNADFSNKAAEVADGINQYVQKQTGGKIQSLVTSVSPDASSLVLDAVYFRGNWETPFSSGPLRTFYNEGSLTKAKNVPFLKVTGSFPYLVTREFQLIELPYVGENVVLLVVLPTRTNGLQELEEALTTEQIEKAMSQLKPTNVKVNLPRFSLEYERDFSQDIAALGARSIFSGPADFSGMTSSADVTVSAALHKVVLDVVENQSQTRRRRSLSGPNAPPARFNANHPFLYAVVDKRNDLFVFLGRVNNL